MSFYAYPPTEPCFSLTEVRAARAWTQYVVTFPVARPTGYTENNTGRGEFYLPSRQGPTPLAVLVHGWGDRSAIPCRALARALVTRGIACFVLYLVFHSSRMPASVRERGINLTPEEWREGYRTSVIDVRQVLDWWAARNGSSPKTAVVGVSLGGIISAIAMGLDKRIHAGVCVVTGGNYELPEWDRRKNNRRDPATLGEALARFASYRAEVTEKGFENVTPPKESYLTDPLPQVLQ